MNLNIDDFLEGDYVKLLTPLMTDGVSVYGIVTRVAMSEIHITTIQSDDIFQKPDIYRITQSQFLFIVEHKSINDKFKMLIEDEI